MIDKTDSVFISYRRKTSKYPALLVFKDLNQHGYDVFIDYESIDSGKFEQRILNQIKSRRHFIVILSPGCLDRTVQPDDWLRKEIEYAIDKQRNVVPMLFDNFDFEKAEPYLTGKLAALDDYNGLTVPDGYFDEAMAKLRNRFLKQPTIGVVEPVVKTDKKYVLGTLQKAYDAAKGKEVQLAAKKYIGGKSQPFIIDTRKKQSQPQPDQEGKTGFRSSKVKWLSVSKLLQDRIVDQIYGKVIERSNGEWDIGIFRISYSQYENDESKKKQPKWSRELLEYPRYSLSSKLINTDLIRRYDSNTYKNNKEDFDRYTFKLPFPGEDSSSALNFRIPSMDEVRKEFIFRRRLNLELNMSGKIKFTKTDIENFTEQLIDIHKAHHIPMNVIEVKAVK